MMRSTSANEEAKHIGENGPCQPNVALPIHLHKTGKELDEEVRYLFDHASAMLRSLASATKIVELVMLRQDTIVPHGRSGPNRLKY